MKKAYKVFNPNWTCRDYDFKDEKSNAIGTTHKIEGQIRICDHGFHYCPKLVDCFNYYDFDSKNKVAEIEVIGDFKDGNNGKEVTSEFKIIRELTWFEVLELVNIGTDNTGYRNSGDQNSGNRNSGYQNSGNWNSGYQNSGDQNSGYRNSGNRNSGDWNSGNRNSGDWNSGYQNSGDRNSGDRNSGNRNSGDWNSGYQNSGNFNTITPDTILVFNKECKVSNWENAIKPDFIYFDYLTKFIWSSDMTEQEKEEHPEHECLEGYLKKMTYHEAFKYSWENADKEDRKLVLELPNFDNEIFKEISGIDVLEELKKES